MLSPPTLLLIEDESRLRQVIARVLELEGYVVLQTPAAVYKPWPSTLPKFSSCSPM